MRFADVQLSFSTMMVAIIISAIFQATFGSEFYSKFAIVMLVVIIGIAEWPQYARTVRASVLAEKKKEYVEAAKVMGFRAPRIMFRHILPNCLSPILVISTVQVANAIMSGSSTRASFGYCSESGKRPSTPLAIAVASSSSDARLMGSAGVAAGAADAGPLPGVAPAAAL